MADINSEIDDLKHSLWLSEEQVKTYKDYIKMLDKQFDCAISNYKVTFQKISKECQNYKLDWPVLKPFEKLEGDSFHFLETYFNYRDDYAGDDKTLERY